MHAWFAFVSGVLFVVGILLIVSASIGFALYGLAIQIEAAIAILFIAIAAIAAWLFYAGIKAQYTQVKTGEEALIGAKGIVTKELAPKGEIRVLGEFWQATTKDGTLAVGAEVEVTGLEGMFLVVVPVKQKA